MNIRKITIALVALSTIAACQQGPNKSIFSKQNIGTAAGAIGGAWLGSNVGKGKGRIVGIAAGALLGAGLGNSLGKTLDKADMAYHEKASQKALESAPKGKTVAWKNPDTGHSGTITPVKTTKTKGVYCREYKQTITIDGKQEKAYGKACRQPDGVWKIKD